MKVGILTFHDGINYGAFLQVYSLKRVLEAKGYDVEIINYKGLTFWFKEYVHFIKKDFKLFSNFSKIVRFSKIHKEYLNMTSFHFKLSLMKGSYDCVYFGSDEIWNINNPGFGMDLSYFGKGVETRKISYAPSFGATKDSDNKLPQLLPYLNEFEKISVRDYNSKYIVDSLVGKGKSELVLDPTLLIEQDSIVSSIDFKEKYLLLYASVNLSEPYIRDICSYAKKNNLCIVSVGFEHRFADYNFTDIDPFEWLGFIKNAEAVVTTMFHGSLLSVVFGKPLSIILTNYRIQKFSYMLDVLNMSSSIWEEGSELYFDNSAVIPLDEVERSKRFLEL